MTSLPTPAIPPPPSFLNGADYMALPIPERPYLIEHLVPEGGLVNLFAIPKSGKATALHTSIPTPDGMRIYGDLRKGDRVFDEWDRPCEVEEIGEVLKNRPCYRVTFKDGSSIVADAAHEWPVWDGVAETQDLLRLGVLDIFGHRLASVVPVASVPVRCIQVSSKSHLFKLGTSGVPTHNSFLALQMASAVSSGDETFLGFRVKPGKVAYFQLDTPRSLWVPRVRMLHDAGLDMSHIYFADREMPGVPYPFNIIEHQKWLTGQLGDVRPELLFVDTLREVFNGNENDSDVMKLVINSVVASAPNCAIFFLSHRKKMLPPIGVGTPGTPDQPTDLMNDNRGSTYIPGRMDVVMCCTPTGIAYQGRAVELSTLPAKQVKALNGGWALEPEELAWRNAIAALPDDITGEREQVSWVHAYLADVGQAMGVEQVRTRMRTGIAG